MRTWFWTLILFIAAVALALVLREHAGNVYLVTPHYLARASLTYVVLCTLGLFIVLYVLLRLLAWVLSAILQVAALVFSVTRDQGAFDHLFGLVQAVAPLVLLAHADSRQWCRVVL